MKRAMIALWVGLTLLTGTASAEQLPTLNIDGAEVQTVMQVEHGTTYVSLRTVVQTMDQAAQVSWENGGAFVYTDTLKLVAVPGREWIEVNGRCLYVPGGVKLREGRTLVPVRVLAEALGAEVAWSGAANLIRVQCTGDAPNAEYQADDLYWLSRIISAESGGESLQGQIAVGNVVLRRVVHSEFPNTIYGVIFDDRWGGQFEPVRNGTVYAEPTEQSVVAAKLSLEGANVARESLYFLNPRLAGNFWTPQNRPYIMTIGSHDFYG